METGLKLAFSETPKTGFLTSWSNYKIATTEDIKGITYAHYEIKKSLFADGASFVLDGNPKNI